MTLPKLIATSVVRGSEKGQSHGGVYTIDFNTLAVKQHIDWNKGDIDFAGRGWDRGLRGIAFQNDKGISIKLEGLPLPNKEGEVWLKLFEDDGNRSQQAGSAAAPLDDSIPF